MPHFVDEKFMPYSQKQLFDMIADVANYPEFLPWCMDARIYNKKENQFDADLIIGFKAFKERFTSRVTLHSPNALEVDYIKGPMKELYNHWKFIKADGGTLVDFEVEFEFKSKLLGRMIGPVFAEATHRMINAFEARAKELYG